MKDEEYDKFEDDSEEFISMLENEGVLGWVGMAADGDRLMSFDMDKLKNTHPELHEVIIEDINNSIIDLYDKGLVEVEYDEDLKATFTISDEGKELLESLGFDLHVEDEIDDNRNN